MSFVWRRKHEKEENDGNHVPPLTKPANTKQKKRKHRHKRRRSPEKTAKDIHSQNDDESCLITSSFRGIPVKIVSSFKSLQTVTSELASYSPSYLGVDCEWKPKFKKGRPENKVSVLQIAHPNIIIIVRLNKIENVENAARSSGLSSLLSNENIIKCGVGIEGDKKKLFHDHNIEMLGCVELNDLYQECIPNAVGHTVGLKRMSRMVLGEEMEHKSKKITMSNWETKGKLSAKQVRYAADDAIVSYLIFAELTCISNEHPLLQRMDGLIVMMNDLQ